MNESILNRVSRLICETFGARSLEINMGTIAEDVPGWDSLSHTILMLEIEDEFGISLPVDTTNFANVGELVNLISQSVKP